MKEAVLKLDLHDEKAKQKAMKTVSSLSGVDSISMDMKDKKLTVIGDVDPMHIGSKLRKLCNTEIITVGPAKEPEKKEEPKKIEDQKQKVVMAHRPNYPYMIPHRTVEEKPNKSVLKLDLSGEKAKKKAMKTISSLSGVDSISMDMKDKKLTVIGDVDPLHMVNKLRKLCNTEIITVGPAKEPEKKKDDQKKK